MDRGHLRSVEADPPTSPRDHGHDGGDGNTGLESRVTALETHLKYLATKTDIQGLKTWILAGVIGGMITAAVLTLAAVRLYSRCFCADLLAPAV